MIAKVGPYLNILDFLLFVHILLVWLTVNNSIPQGNEGAHNRAWAFFFND